MHTIHLSKLGGFDWDDPTPEEKAASLDTGLAFSQEVPDHDKQVRYSRKVTHGNKQEDINHVG